ncbi:MAG: YggS family pyridoxal phosphate-dependent enzyme [bacterium]|nr:YggS family pyridoxal phosphate-dependent enzyme [bacterium]
MTLNANLKQIQKIIAETQTLNHEASNHVLLLAVSKQQSSEKIKALYELGVTDFGENYLQEAHVKIAALAYLPIVWHFIGPIQSNKCKEIAKLFNWVHSIDRFSIAQHLNKHRDPNAVSLNVCLQIKLIDENNKSGISLDEAAELAFAVNQLPHLHLRGLMTIPPPQKNEQDQYHLFLQLKQLMHTLNQKLGLTMDTLSMGMSDDLIPAIQAGSTIVRVGQALFGPRTGITA